MLTGHARFVTIAFQRQKQKTPVIQKTLDPHWPTKDATFDFPLYKSVAERLGTLLEIVVWDKDFVGKGACIPCLITQYSLLTLFRLSW